MRMLHFAPSRATGWLGLVAACGLAASAAVAKRPPVRPPVALEESGLVGVPQRAPARTVYGDDGDRAMRFVARSAAGATAAMPASGDPVRGVFSPAFDWPLVAIHAVLTPDGRVFSYGTDAKGVQTGYFVYDVWDPAFGTGPEAHQLLPNQTAVDIFCGAQLLQPDGTISLFGGDITVNGRSTNKPTAEVTRFDPADNSLAREATMARSRWYATATMLPNGETYIQGGDGGRPFPEIRGPDGSFRSLVSARTNQIHWFYPRNFVGSDGKIFGISRAQMYRVDPTGSGSITLLGTLGTGNIGTSSTAVMFAPDRILQVGGGPDTYNGSAQASIIQVTEGAPVVTAQSPMNHGRHWATATVLADGRVLVSGGSRVKNARDGVAYEAELFDPATGAWTPGAVATRMRLYHSTSLLLPDATVLTAGGGAPGPQRNLNAEIYYPPYLFAADGSPAQRPVIDSAPMSLGRDQVMQVDSRDAAMIERAVLVKTGSVTHSFDMDQRFIELAMMRTGDERLEAWLPASAQNAPPGMYMLFLIDADGVPSQAAMLRVELR